MSRPTVVVWRTSAQTKEPGENVKIASSVEMRLVPVVEDLFSIAAQALPDFPAPEVIVVGRVGDAGPFIVESLDERTTEYILRLLPALRKGGQA